MFVEITNTPRPYAWGSTTAIARLLGLAPSGGPEAELWLGAHPGSPSRVLHPDQAGGAADLANWIGAARSAALGESYDGPRLPFLLKVLAAEHPLSLQAHPSAAQARAGYLREDEAGVPLDAPHRNYRDPYPKPEMIYALSDRFDALCGFRPVEEALDVLQGFVDLDVRGDTPQAALLYDFMDRLESLPEAFEWLLAGGTEAAALVARVSRIAQLAGYAGRDAFPEFVGADALPGAFGIDRELATVRLLAEEYPGDPGIVVSLLLNQVSLSRGEALYLPAGNIHAYLHGVGIELMAASDNVLRGGLTPKHVDVPELLRVLDFTAAAPPVNRGRPDGAWIRYDTPAEEFLLRRWDASPPPGTRLDGPTDHVAVPDGGPRILLCTAGSACVRSADGELKIGRGMSLWLSAVDTGVTVNDAADGTQLFLAGDALDV
jgi:mannose-6-phosphate isomerase